MTRTLTLVTLAVAVGLDFKAASKLIQEIEPTLPEDDMEAGKAVAAAASANLWQSPNGG